MKRFGSILLPLDGSPESAKAAGCALWLAENLGATLHVLHATPQPLPGREALARLQLPQAAHAQVVVHEVAQQAEAAVLEAVQQHRVDLVVMSAHGESACAGLAPLKRLGSVARAVLQASPVPVVLLPTRYVDKDSLPWRSMLVAASGEPAADDALQAAVHMAAALQLRVQVMHCGDVPTFGGAYADAAQYEYAPRLEGIVEAGLAACPPEEAGCVEQALLRGGDPVQALLDHVRQQGTSVLALGWHGVLGTGRALVLKRLLEEAGCALLLVRKPELPAAQLKVGKDIDD